MNGSAFGPKTLRAERDGSQLHALSLSDAADAIARACRRSSTQRWTRAAESGALITKRRCRSAKRRSHFFRRWLSESDAIITPAAPGPALAGLDSTGDPSCCTLWSLTGFPALTLPIAVVSTGLPLGMQLATPAGDDDRLLAVAAWCEPRFGFAGLVGRPADQTVVE